MLLIGVLAISFAAPLFKLTQPTHPLLAAALRLTLASILWSTIAFFSGQKLITSHQAQNRTAILCGFCYAVHFGAWVWSLGLTSIIASATLVTTTPIMLAVIALLSGRDKPDKKLLGSGLIACCGISVFAFDHQGQLEFLYGDLLALLGALAMVPYLLLTRALGSQLQLAPFSAIATLIGALTLWLIIALFLPPEALHYPSTQAILALIGLALIPQMIGHSALTVSLRFFTPTEVGLATLLEPLGASLLGWLWLNETLSAWSLLASLLTLMGVTLALRLKRQTQENGVAISQQDS